jgi:hypothetical protein
LNVVVGSALFRSQVVNGRKAGFHPVRLGSIPGGCSTNKATSLQLHAAYRFSEIGGFFEDKNMINRPLRVISLGAGVQSSTMALMAAHGEIDMPDCAIFADVQDEMPEVYKWLDWLEKQLPYPVHRISRGKLSEESLIVKTSKAGNKYQQHSPPFFIINEKGQIGMMMRQCTTNFKIIPIIKKLRELGGKKHGVEQYIGISLDESQRMKPARDKWITNRWPLIEKFMTRGHCIEWMTDHGFPIPPRSSCRYCIYHSDAEWNYQQTNQPDQFELSAQYEESFQNAMLEIPSLVGKPYLHRSCKPLREIDFKKLINTRQIDMFNNECEGICGV